MKTKVYYHILEYGHYGQIGWQGYELTIKEAQKRANDLAEMFPKSDFIVESYNSKKEPTHTTV